MSVIISLLFMGYLVAPSLAQTCTEAEFYSSFTVPSPFSEVGTHTFFADGSAVHFGALPDLACAYVTRATWTVVSTGNYQYNMTIQMYACDSGSCQNNPCAAFPILPITFETLVLWAHDCSSFVTPSYFNLTWAKIPICAKKEFYHTYNVQGPGPELAKHTFFSNGSATHTGAIGSCSYSSLATWDAIPSGSFQDQLTITQISCNNGTCLSNPCANFPAGTIFSLIAEWDNTCTDFVVPAFFNLNFVQNSASNKHLLNVSSISLLLSIIILLY